MAKLSSEIRELSIEDLDHVAGGMAALGMLYSHFRPQIGSVFAGPIIGTAIGAAIGGATTGTGDESDARCAKPKP